MKTILIVLMTGILMGLMLPGAYAVKHLPEDRGKAHFNAPSFAGGKIACNSCHPDGKGLETAATKKKLMTPAGPADSLEEAINLCIVNAAKGEAIDPDSARMKDLIAYIRSLGDKKPAGKKVPGY
jgi:cytochrome c